MDPRRRVPVRDVTRRATMCYMEQVGIRELRQQASRYVERAAAGETFQVTDRGRPVALLTPLVRGEWDRLVAAGQASEPASPIDPRSILPENSGVDVSERLAALRADER